MTVEEWLGSDNKLGIDIWNKKYKYGDETFDEWLDRISGGDKELKEIIKEKKFLFGGRILSNRGLDKYGVKTTYSNCFPRGTLVYTKEGYKPIERIEKGEFVLTHKNRFRQVNATMSRVYDGELSIIDGYNFDRIVCTSNHKFLTANGWREAKDITEEDYMKCELINSFFDDDGHFKFGFDTTKFKYDNGDYYLRVKNKFTLNTSSLGQSIEVFNISVEEDNSYVVNDIVAHNCYVITPPEDNIESIFDCAKKLARTYSYGGGCGVDLSGLAPRGSKVNNTAKETSGAVSFTDLYSLVTGLIGQNGRRK